LPAPYDEGAALPGQGKPTGILTGILTGRLAELNTGPRQGTP
jgi:hypothetical protein